MTELRVCTVMYCELFSCLLLQEAVDCSASFCGRNSARRTCCSGSPVKTFAKNRIQSVSARKRSRSSTTTCPFCHRKRPVMLVV